MAALAFTGTPPDAAELSREWHEMMETAHKVHDALPGEEVGKCVVDRRGRLYRGDVDSLRRDLGAGETAFHAGNLRGTLPRPIDAG